MDKLGGEHAMNEKEGSRFIVRFGAAEESARGKVLEKTGLRLREES